MAISNAREHSLTKDELLPQDPRDDNSPITEESFLLMKLTMFYLGSQCANPVLQEECFEWAFWFYTSDARHL